MSGLAWRCWLTGGPCVEVAQDCREPRWIESQTGEIGYGKDQEPQARDDDAETPESARSSCGLGYGIHRKRYKGLTRITYKLKKCINGLCENIATGSLAVSDRLRCHVTKGTNKIGKRGLILKISSNSFGLSTEKADMLKVMSWNVVGICLLHDSAPFFKETSKISLSVLTISAQREAVGEKGASKAADQASPSNLQEVQ